MTTPTATAYLSEVVLYGGEEITRGEMIADLQRVAAATCPGDSVRQQILVGRYVQGFEVA